MTWTYLSTHTVINGQTEIDIKFNTKIYKNFRFEYTGLDVNADASLLIRLGTGGVIDSGSNYDSALLRTTHLDVISARSNNSGTSIPMYGGGALKSDASITKSATGVIEIMDIPNSVNFDTVTIHASNFGQIQSSNKNCSHHGYGWYTHGGAEVDIIRFTLSTSSFIASGYIRVYARN